MRKEKVGRLVLPNFKTSCIAAVIKTVLYWHKDKHKDQWNRVESPETKPYIYDELIFNKLPRQLSGGKILSSTNDTEKTGNPCAGSMT